MKSIQALREQIAARAREVKALVENKNAAWTAESQSAYDTAIAEIDDCKAQIDRLEKTMNLLAEDDQTNAIADAAAHRAGRAGTTNAHASKVRNLFATWMRNGDRAISAEDWQLIRNTMSTTTGSEGGVSSARIACSTSWPSSRGRLRSSRTSAGSLAPSRSA